ncbi:MAG: RNA polymerase sigma factor [Bacteroidales bacterium]|nr:RNA polymerase sigma factor [Bacteroidales bacterium]
MTSQKFSTEYLPLAPMLYRIAFHILERQDEAEDAVQETFLKLWEIRDKLDDVESAKAYSIRILKNECLDRLRKAKKSVPADQVLVREPISPTDEQIDARRRLEKVLGAIKSLPDSQKQVLLLRTVEGLSYEEISKKMGMSQLTLRVLLTRARGALRNLSGRKI